MRILILLILPSLAFGDYDRSTWKHWIDADGDCQDTRQEILIRYSLVPPTLSEDGCRVVSGAWVGQYSGKVFTDPGELDIDHIVPLRWANDHGGEEWSELLKQVFANDPENLLPVKASENRSKGAKGPDEWMPKLNKELYIQQWKSVAGRYGLRGK